MRHGQASVLHPACRACSDQHTPATWNRQGSQPASSQVGSRGPLQHLQHLLVSGACRSPGWLCGRSPHRLQVAAPGWRCPPSLAGLLAAQAGQQPPIVPAGPPSPQPVLAAGALLRAAGRWLLTCQPNSLADLTCWPAGVPGASTQPGPGGDDEERGTALPAEEEQSLADLMSSLTGSKPVQLPEEEEQSLADLMSSLTGEPMQLHAPLPDGL